MVEKWRLVTVNPNYLVSNLGGIKRVHGARLNPTTTKRGYQIVCLQGKVYQVHSLILEAFVGPRPKGNECRHLDGKPGNNRLTNLRWGTPKENGEDRAIHGTWSNGGRSLKGSLNPQAKLTDQDVKDIMEMKRRGVKQKDIAILKKVSDATISLIVRKLKWVHFHGRQEETV